MSESGFHLPEFDLDIAAVDLVKKCWESLGSWRSFVIAIDGRDGVGKTALASYLAYRMNMPHISGDLFLIPGQGLKHYDCLGEILNRRLRYREGAPLIFESVFALDVLESFKIAPNLTIRVAQVGRLGDDSWQPMFRDYEKRQSPNFWFIRKCEQAPENCMQVESGYFSQCDDCPSLRHYQSSGKPPWAPIAQQ